MNTLTQWNPFQTARWNPFKERAEFERGLEPFFSCAPVIEVKAA